MYFKQKWRVKSFRIYDKCIRFSKKNKIKILLKIFKHNTPIYKIQISNNAHYLYNSNCYSDSFIIRYDIWQRTVYILYIILLCLNI